MTPQRSLTTMGGSAATASIMAVFRAPRVGKPRAVIYLAMIDLMTRCPRTS
ncbi:MULTISPECIES: hypothetical protein [unclassified Streptomyces]|uniref:hypothetical protein n=1 Tax=unclassified Streptomyces TaxID=2593676 RepID=UPI00344C3D5A